MNPNKALVKSTGSILDIKDYCVTYTIPVTFGSNYSDKIKELFDSYKLEVDFEVDDIKIDPDKVKVGEAKKEKQYYILSDGNKYSGDELVVGSDEIRNLTIKTILDGNEQEIH